MATFYQRFHEKLINELEFEKADMDRELSKWIEEYGSEKDMLSQFYKSCLELRESHFSREKLIKSEHNKDLRKVYLLMLDLFIKANWSRTKVTKKLNELNMMDAENYPFNSRMEIIPPGQCSYAEQFRNKKFDFESARKEFPLDYTKCERDGGCVCTVGFEAVRDENGRLILK